MPPVAYFVANVVSGTNPLTVFFTESSTNTPTSWSWDFGDGQTSTLQNPSHTYTVNGVYIVTLTATNASGSDTYTRSDYINVTGIFTYSWDLADSTDIPTITVSSVAAGAASTISSSAGWYREKRMATDEVAPGGSQSSTNTLDLKGSSHFIYPGVPVADGTTSNPGQYVNTGYKPGGSTASTFWLFNLEFGTSSPTIELRINSVATDLFFHVRVNGKRISQQSSDFTVTAGSGYGIKLAFTGKKYRRISVHGLNNTQGRWGGVAVEGGYSVIKPNDAVHRTVAIIGDSYVNGVGGGLGGARSTETFAWKLATLLGAGNIIQAGIGGTGWGAMLSSDPTSTFSGRVANVMAFNPDIVIAVGGRSDSASGLQAAVESYIDSVGYNVEQYIVRSNATTSSTITSAIQTAANNKGVTFVNLDIDSYAKYTDNVSLTLAAHEQFAQDIYNVIRPFVPDPRTLWYNGYLVKEMWLNGNQYIMASDGTIAAPQTTTKYNVFNGAAPGTTQTVYTDGGGSLIVGNRFYTTETNGIYILGLRIYNPSSASGTFLARTVTAYAYMQDWTGSEVTSTSTFATSPSATKTYTTPRTAGTWTDILFDSPITLPKASSAASGNDIVTLAVQFSGGTDYVYVTPTPGGVSYYASTVRPGTYLADDTSPGKGANTLATNSINASYGIDIIYQPVTP